MLPKQFRSPHLFLTTSARYRFCCHLSPTLWFCPPQLRPKQANPLAFLHTLSLCQGIPAITAWSAGSAAGAHAQLLTRSSSTEMLLLKSCFFATVHHMKTKFSHINQLRIVHVLRNPEDLNFIDTYQKQLAITLQRCSQELAVAQLIDAYCFTQTLHVSLIFLIRICFK